MHPAKTRAVLTAAAACTALTLAGCGSGGGTSESTPTPERTSTVEASPSHTPEPTTPAEGTAVVVTIGGTALPGQLWDNPAARDLAARLPVTLTFRDYDAVEKIARLDAALTMDGMPDGDDPNPGEIGWFAPSSDVILYYGDVGYWNGIARLGTFDASGVRLLADGPDAITLTITRADR